MNVSHLKTFAVSEFCIGNIFCSYESKQKQAAFASNENCSNLDVWSGYENLSVKPSWSEQSAVQDVHAVGGRENDDVGRTRVEAVHLDKKLKDDKQMILIQ